MKFSGFDELVARGVWEKAGFRGRRFFFWNYVVLRRLVPLLLLLGFVNHARASRGDLREELFILSFTFFVSLAVLLPIAWIWASRYWKESASRFGGPQYRVKDH